MNITYLDCEIMSLMLLGVMLLANKSVEEFKTMEGKNV